MVNVETKVIVHRGDGHSILQIFGQKTRVGHVIMQGIVQFNVDVANQRIPHILLDENKKMFRFQRVGEKPEFSFRTSVTSSSSSQASLLGAKKVKDPVPSISGLTLEMSEYF